MSPRARAAIGAAALLGCVLVIGGAGSYLLARRAAERFFAGFGEIGPRVAHIELSFRPRSMDGRLKVWTAIGCQWETPSQCCDFDPRLYLTATGAIAATGPSDLRAQLAHRRQALAICRENDWATARSRSTGRCSR